MSRGQLLRLLVGVVALTAVAAVVVATPPGDGRPSELTAGTGGGDFEVEPGDLLPLEPTTTTALVEATTSTSLAPAVTSPPTTRRPAPTTTSPTPPTSSGPAPSTTVPLPPATLDPGEPVCSGPPEGGLIRGDV